MLATPACLAKVQPARPVRDPPTDGADRMGQAPMILRLVNCSPPGVQTTIQWTLGACPILPGWAAPFPGGSRIGHADWALAGRADVAKL